MSGKRIVRIGIWVVLAIVAVVIVRAIVDDDEGASNVAAAEIVSLDELSQTASDQASPIYWAGTQPETELELNRPDESSTYVRYLTGGAEAGDSGTDFLTVGTYAFPDAAEALTELSQKPGGVSAKTPDGGVMYFNRSRPENVYIAYPGEDVQIEVYDPDPKRALGLAASGKIVPIG